MSSPASGVEIWKTLLSQAPPRVRSSVEAAGAASDSPYEFMASVLEPSAKPSHAGYELVRCGLLAKVLSNPTLLTLDQAIRLARAAQRLESCLDNKLLDDVTRSTPNFPHGVHEEEMMRILNVIDAISDCRRLVMPLMKFLKLDGPLRSKAVKLLARGSPSAWTAAVSSDADPRVRSNLIEGLAGHLGKKVIPLLRTAAQDPHHRVSVTALLALARLGDQESVLVLKELAAGKRDAFQQAASWAMRQLEKDAPAQDPCEKNAPEKDASQQNAPEQNGISRDASGNDTPELTPSTAAPHPNA